MSKNGLVSCQADLLILNHFNSDIPNHLLAKKFSLDRHTVQKYVKETFIPKKTILNAYEFKYLENAFYLKETDSKKNLDFDYSSEFQKVVLSKEGSVENTFLELSSSQEILDIDCKAKDEIGKKEIDLFEKIVTLNNLEIRKELSVAQNRQIKILLSNLTNADFKSRIELNPQENNPMVLKETDFFINKNFEKSNVYETSVLTNSVPFITSSAFICQTKALQR